MQPLRVLVLAYALDGEDIGGVYSAFRWVEALSHHAHLTVLASHRGKTRPLAEQLPNAEVVTWPEPRILHTRFERINAQAKPWLPFFGRKAAAWLRARLAEGRRFDIAHQILPQAMRYATPLRHFPIPYVMGPVDGGLETPEGFRAEVGPDPGIAKLRALDSWRLRHDGALRSSYARAGIVIGSAPYIHERLVKAGLTECRFATMLERGHGVLPDLPQRQAVPGRLRLLHVGRTIRTKGLRDVVRAMAHLRDLPDVTLVSAGDGPDLAACRAEAERLGVADRITFLGRIPRDQVDAEYRAADVFCFPSFREPMGGVFFEAMEWGLPVITAARGGPDFIVDETCGIRLPVENPEHFARAIADAVRRLANDPALRHRLGQGSRARVQAFGTWDDKARHMIATYQQVIAQHQGAAA